MISFFWLLCTLIPILRSSIGMSVQRKFCFLEICSGCGELLPASEKKNKTLISFIFNLSCPWDIWARSASFCGSHVWIPTNRSNFNRLTNYWWKTLKKFYFKQKFRFTSFSIIIFHNLIIWYEHFKNKNFKRPTDEGLRPLKIIFKIYIKVKKH